MHQLNVKLYIFCIILIFFLFIFSLQKKAMGSDLYEQVFYSLDLIEKDYFGLQFTDANHVKHWLDPTKAIKKQVKSGWIIYFLFFVVFVIIVLNFCFIFVIIIILNFL